MAKAITNETEVSLVQADLAGTYEELTPVNGVGADLDKETFEYLREDRIISANEEQFMAEQTQTFVIPQFTMPGGVPGVLV